MSPGLWLRLAGPPDAGVLAELERAASQHPWSEAQLRDEVGREGPDAVLVIVDRDGVRAYCALRIVLDEAHVMNLAVHPLARRRGLGRFLLRKALERAARAGARRALLEVRASNAAARALYAECGFVGIGERRGYYREPAEDALVLAREGLSDGS